MEMHSLQKKKGLDWRTLLCICVMLCFVSRVALIPHVSYDDRWRLLFHLASLLLAGPILGMTEAGKQFGTRVLLLGFLWMSLVCIRHFAGYEEDPSLIMTYLVLACFCMLLYPSALLLDEVWGKRLFRIVGFAYIACVAVLCVLTLYAAFTGHNIPSPSGDHYIAAGVSFSASGKGRLILFCNPIEASVVVTYALLLVVVLFTTVRRRVFRILLAAAALLFFVAISLFDARSACIAFSVCIGGGAYLVCDVRLPLQNGWRRICLSVGVALAAAVLCFFMLRLTADTLNPLFPKLGKLRAANASIDTLSGRTIIWKATLKMLRDHPRIFLFGAGPMQVMEYVYPYQPANFTYLGHPHNVLLNVLTVYGLVGLLLFFTFCTYLLKHAMRLFIRGGDRCNFFERALPLLLAFALVMDLVDCFLSFYDSLDISAPWFLFAAGYVVRLSQTRWQAEDAKMPRPAKR